jgi:hypothetical protein
MNSSIDEMSLHPPQTTNTALERTKRLAVSNLSRGRSVLGNSKSSLAPHATTCDVLPEVDELAITWVMRSFAKIATAVSLSLVRVLRASRPLGLLFKAVTTYAQLDINVDNLSSEYDNPVALTCSTPRKRAAAAGWSGLDGLRGRTA